MAKERKLAQRSAASTGDKHKSKAKERVRNL